MLASETKERARQRCDVEQEIRGRHGRAAATRHLPGEMSPSEVVLAQAASGEDDYGSLRSSAFLAWRTLFT
jgi:hypothetical protein